jgi:hypothetical protein
MLHIKTVSTQTTSVVSGNTFTNSNTYQTTCAPVNWGTANTQTNFGSWYGASAPPSQWVPPKSTFTIHGVELDLDEILKILKFKYTQEELEIMAMGLRLTREEKEEPTP